MTLQETIQRFFDSPFQLELLVAMAQDPERAWTERDVADTFGMPLWQARRDLQLLCSRNALDVRIGVAFSIMALSALVLFGVSMFFMNRGTGMRE